MYASFSISLNFLGHAPRTIKYDTLGDLRQETLAEGEGFMLLYTVAFHWKY